MSFLSSLFPSYSQRQIKKLEGIADKIDALAGTYSAMSDEQLKAQTEVFRSRLAAGETTDDILKDIRELLKAQTSTEEAEAAETTEA